MPVNTCTNHPQVIKKGANKVDLHVAQDLLNEWGMKKILWTISVAASLSSGFEVSQDSIESSWTGGDSIWFRNKSALPVTIKNIYAKKITGNIGDGLLFKASNEKKEINGGFTHWYQLRNLGDSLYIPPESWSQNPVIRIPSFDSISIKSILYGTCIFCASNSQPYNYRLKLYFVADGNDYAEITLIGSFITGGIYKRIGWPGRIESEYNFTINGKKLKREKIKGDPRYLVR